MDPFFNDAAPPAHSVVDAGIKIRCKDLSRKMHFQFQGLGMEFRFQFRLSTETNQIFKIDLNLRHGINPYVGKIEISESLLGPVQYMAIII